MWELFPNLAVSIFRLCTILRVMEMQRLTFVVRCCVHRWEICNVTAIAVCLNPGSISTWPFGKSCHLRLAPNGSASPARVENQLAAQSRVPPHAACQREDADRLFMSAVHLEKADS